MQGCGNPVDSFQELLKTYAHVDRAFGSDYPRFMWMADISMWIRQAKIQAIHGFCG